MVVVYGTVCLDRTRMVPRLPAPGEYVEVSDETLAVGGEASNTAVALAAWGGEFVLAGNAVRALEDVASLEGRAVPVRLLREDGLPTPVCDIYVTSDGQRTMFGLGFAGLPERAGPPPAAGPGDWLTTDSNLGAAAAAALRVAASAGARTYALDYPAAGTYADVWQSSTDLFGQRGDLQHNLAWLKGRLQGEPGFSILSDAANGFVAGGTAPDGQAMPVRHYPPFPCPKVVDSTGAGDVFRAGMLFGLHRGWRLADCLQFASAAGCLNCQWPGASVRVPSLDEVLGHIASNPDIAAAYADVGQSNAPE